ncbi:MAG TPA: type II toxin-antitoxin system VapC family toxin [Candidatus Nanopelagicales bacterium]|nr:type II toxin-antitoxin system VapC family toxin [Candidatus Nanopelagicales bacterium]
MGFLIDTNVISELRKSARCDPQVSTWFQSVVEDDIFLSVLVIGEVRRGIEKARPRDPLKAAALENWLKELVTSYRRRILPISTEIAERWGRLSVPDPLPVVDGLLAATALVHRLTLVTRNTDDVKRTGVVLLNPFLGTPTTPAQES